MPGKRVQLDDETWHAVNLLGNDRMATFQELAEEAFAELLKKYDRPTTLKAALRKSANMSADVVPFRKKKAVAKKRTGAKRRAPERPF